MTDRRETLMRKVLQKIASERGYRDPEVTAAALPGTGANFSSQLFNATITASGKDKLTLFGKVAMLGESFREKSLSKIYDIERYAYTTLLNFYKEIEDKHKVPKEHRLVTPEFYGYNETRLEEVIVLEDLSGNGFTINDRMKPVDWDYAAAAVVELAKLHSLSLAFQKEYPEEYNEAAQGVLVWDLLKDGAAGGFLKQIRANATAMVDAKHMPRLLRFFDEKIDEQTIPNFYKPIKRPVIIHSDMKPSNLMHKIHKNGKPQVVVVDYQTLQPGSAAVDLMTFLACGSDGAFRREHFTRFLEFYYENMAAALRRLDLDPEEAFPKADFEYEVKQLMPMLLVFAFLSVPIITGDHSNLPDSGEADSFQSLVNEDKIGENLVGKQRLNEFVEDFARWGYL